MKIRKIAHNYWDYEQQTQEIYLNIRYQVSYLEAGYYLRSIEVLKSLTPLFFQLAIGSTMLGIATKSLRKAKLI